jgi:hypothetical protein
MEVLFRGGQMMESKAGEMMACVEDLVCPPSIIFGSGMAQLLAPQLPVYIYIYIYQRRRKILISNCSKTSTYVKQNPNPLCPASTHHHPPWLASRFVPETLNLNGITFLFQLPWFLEPAQSCPQSSPELSTRRLIHAIILIIIIIIIIIKPMLYIKTNPSPQKNSTNLVQRLVTLVKPCGYAHTHTIRTQNLVQILPISFLARQP